MEKITLSIITVSYNSDKYIKECVESIVSQKSKNVEYIIIDGASTDKTTDILFQYRDDINIFISEPDDGIYDAMHKGVIKSNGEYILFINSDDRLNPNSIKYILQCLKSNNDLYFFGVNTFNDKYSIGKIVPNNIEDINNDIYSKRILKMPCCHQGIIAKKKYLIGNYSFDQNLKLSADFSWILNLLYNNNCSIITSDICISSLRLGGRSSSIQSIIETSKIISKYNSFFTLIWWFPFRLFTHYFGSTKFYSFIKKILKIESRWK